MLLFGCLLLVLPQVVVLFQQPVRPLECRLSMSKAGGEEVKALKGALLEAISLERKGKTSLSEVLAATEALEALDKRRAAATGRWSLVFSTLREAPKSEDGPLQALSNQVYETLFRFAPALAGGGTDLLKVKNEQLLTEDGRLENVVEAFDVKIKVRGTAKGDDEVMEVVFEEFRVEAGPFVKFTLPLPRPRGSIVSTFVDDDLRISRGSRGGLFILKRLPPSK